MTALAKDTNVNSKDTGRTISIPLAAATEVFAGSLVSVNAAGFGIPAADTAATIVIGIADEGVNNTGAAGDLRVRCRKGTFELQTAGTVVDQADAGGPVYVADDNTVEKIAGVANNIVAGVLDSLDTETGNPWVRITDPTV